MSATIFVLLLCTGSGSYGQFCITREYRALNDCKAFLASAESLTDNRSGMKSMRGVCVPEQRSNP